MEVLNVRDEKSSGTGGGAFTSGSYVTRALNTVVTNTITGASLSSDQFTLPAGTYNLRAKAPAFRVDNTKAKLRNITDSTDDIIGAPTFSTSDTGSGVNSWVIGQVAITAPKAFEIQHRCTTTQAGTGGRGQPTTYGDIEVYTEVWIERV